MRQILALVSAIIVAGCDQDNGAYSLGQPQYGYPGGYYDTPYYGNSSPYGYGPYYSGQRYESHEHWQQQPMPSPHVAAPAPPAAAQNQRMLDNLGFRPNR
jgi:hypothetical protein